MLSLKARLKKGSTGHDVAILTLGTVVAQIIAIVTTPLLTRLFTPSDFGLLAFFMSITAVFSTLVTLRYESSILVPKCSSESANLVFLCLILGVIFSFSLAVVGSILPSNIQLKIGLSEFGKWLPIAFVTAGAMSVFTVMQGWMNRQKQYNKIAYLRIGQSICLTSLAIFLGIIKVNDGLLIANLCANLLVCALAFYLGRSVISCWDKNKLIETAIIHQNTPKFLLPSALLDVFTLQLPVILITSWFSENISGQFSMAWRLLMLPMSIIGGAISQVFLLEFSLHQNTAYKRRILLIKTWAILAALGLLPAFLFFNFGEYLFKFILGPNWSEAGLFASILAPLAFSMFVSSPTSGTYIILGIQKYSLYFGIASFIYRPACIFIGYLNEDITLGLQLWVFFEIAQNILYQRVAWITLKNLENE